MNLNGSNNDWGSLPQFVWPSVRDRVWVEGRWIFDCGHTGLASGDSNVNDVAYSTEIHPPKAVVTYRLNRKLSAGVPGLPVTGLAQPLPITEADMFVSGMGGPANDYCSLVNRHISLAAPNNVDDCSHTGPIIAVNDRNYVFDVYPPGTDYSTKLPNGTFSVSPPTNDGTGTDVSLQWSFIDHTSLLPKYAGSNPLRSPLVCLVDATTPAPTQAETSCPPVPDHPTRLRVILPFLNSGFDSFAQSLFLGWDDVPAESLASCPGVPGSIADPANPGAFVPNPAYSTSALCPAHTYQVRLHRFTVVSRGECSNLCGRGVSGDWRVFVDVGGQSNYVSGLTTDPETSNCSHEGLISADSLTGVYDGDCFAFDNQPWTVTVQSGVPIHVAIGGFESDAIDSDFCRATPSSTSGCDPPNTATGAWDDIACQNDDRIPTFETDLTAPLYQPPAEIHARKFNGQQCGGFGDLNGVVEYRAALTVTDVTSTTPPQASSLTVGSPAYTNPNTSQVFVRPDTSLIFSSPGPDDVFYQYRFRMPTAPLPNFGSPLGFPLHWTNILPPPTSPTRAATIHLSGTDPGGGFAGDGNYVLQWSAFDFQQGGIEHAHTARFSVDSTPPTITINGPQASSYSHSATITLNYGAIDTGSGVKSVTATMDGSSTLGGQALSDGATLNLLTLLSLGSHTFTVTAVDNVGNTSTQSVVFTIVVTPDSIKADVNQFLASGAIKSQGLANSLLASLNAASDARTRGDCKTASNNYQAFINQINAQSGKGITSQAASIMIGDAQYLIAHCP
jgi:hypothetical protein